MPTIIIREEDTTLTLQTVTVPARTPFVPEISEALTIPIDKNNAGSVAIATGTKFRSQADVDLALGSAPSFLDWMDVLDALSDLETFFPITLTLAGNADQFGRVGDTSTAFDFSRTVFKGANSSWTITGPDPSTWGVFGGFSSQVIASVQAGSNDPFVTTSGTPYTIGALKGLRVRLSTGQVAEIHDNDTSKIRLIEELSPVPTLSDTFDVIRGPRLRNTTDGVTKLVPDGGGRVPFRWSNNRGVPAIAALNTISNLGFDPLGQNNVHHIVQGPDLWFWSRVEFTKEVGSGFTFRAIGSQHFFLNCTHPGSVTARVFDTLIGQPASAFTFQDSYIQTGARHAIAMLSGQAVLIQTMIEGGGSDPIDPGAALYAGPGVDFVSLFSFSSGIRTTFRAPTGVPAIILDGTLLTSNFAGASFESCPSACIRMINGARYDEVGATLFPGLKDGGGNGDVGFELDSRSTLVHQNAGGTDLSGTAGDVRVVGSAPVSYATLNGAPVADLTNFVLASSP